VSGALAERAFARKIEKMGFTDVWIGERIPYGVERAALYPLFTPAVIDLMRELIPCIGLALAFFRPGISVTERALDLALGLVVLLYAIRAVRFRRRFLGQAQRD
jgi:hypothetical protein